MTGKQPNIDWVFFDQRAVSLDLHSAQQPTNILSTALLTAIVDNHSNDADGMKTQFPFGRATD